MRVDAITCCVGEMYAGQLARSLPIWLDTCDSVTVVTRDEYGGVNDLAWAYYNASNLRIVTTDVFNRHGAHFNKGAALCEAYAAANPSDWALHFDSDIIPPADWRAIAERVARPEALSGAFRYSEEGERLDERPLYPYGYFHLWHTGAPQCWRWPLFETWHPHAGSYDANFTDLWPVADRADLGFRLIHQGERRANWFGPGADSELMRKLRRVGLRQARMRSNRGIGRLAIPEPQLRLALYPGDQAWIRDVLQACRLGGPFAVEARVGRQVPRGFEAIDETTPAARIRERVLACSK